MSNFLRILPSNYINLTDFQRFTTIIYRIQITFYNNSCKFWQKFIKNFKKNTMKFLKDFVGGNHMEKTLILENPKTWFDIIENQILYRSMSVLFQNCWNSLSYSSAKFFKINSKLKNGPRSLSKISNSISLKNQCFEKWQFGLLYVKMMHLYRNSWSFHVKLHAEMSKIR